MSELLRSTTMRSGAGHRTLGQLARQRRSMNFV